MELASVTNIRNSYRALLNNDDRYTDILEQLVRKPDREPILSWQGVEAEADLSFQDEQRQLSEILLDMHSLNNGMVELKNIVYNTIESLDASIMTIRDSVRQQREQVEDACTICGVNSAYSATIPIYAGQFPDTSSEIIGDKTLGAAPVFLDQVAYEIVSVSGNGYSGNAFVYQDDDTFQNETDDRSVAAYISDNNDITIYEYSRISTKDKKETVGGVVNYDDKPVECVLTLRAEAPVSKAILHIDEKDLVVKKIEVSDDGLNFRTCQGPERRVNDTGEMYTSYDYVFGCPVLCFPYASFIRLTISSNTPTQDRIAIQEEDGRITQYPAAYRKKIGIRGILLYTAEYEEYTTISAEILSDCAIDKVSLFASEYIPDHFVGTDYISYSLIVNGQEIPVVPVNTGRDGIRIVKYSEDRSAPDSYTSLIDETVRSVKVKIRIKPFNGNESPYVSNLKLCVGKNTGDIYV